MASFFEFTYSDNNMKFIGLILILTWGFLMYYATLPDRGLIIFRKIDDHDFLKQTAHFLTFMIGFVILGPIVINMLPISLNSFGKKR